MTDREAMSLALDALEDSMYPQKRQFDAIVALKQALAQPEQEPVAWASCFGQIVDCITPAEHDRLEGAYTVPLYAAPLKREWVGLTNDEIQTQWNNACLDTVENPGWNRHIRFARTIEAKLKEKNT